MVPKTPIVGILERGGKIVLRVVKKVDKDVLAPTIKANINTEATLVTDGFGGYIEVGKEYASHEVVNHSQDEYVRGIYHTNTLEGFWCLLKHGIVGITTVVSPQHLHRYCTEFGSRYTNREETNIYRFQLFVKDSNVRLTYKELTSGK